jgi:hypothetical protein
MTRSQHVYEIRPRKDKRGVDLISAALPFRHGQWLASATHSPSQAKALSRRRLHAKSRLAMIRPVSNFFEIDAPTSVLGDFKYGDIERARALNLFPTQGKNRFFTVKIEETPHPKFKPQADSFLFHWAQGTPGRNFIHVDWRWAKRWRGFMEIDSLFSAEPVLRFNPAFRRWALSRLSKFAPVSDYLTDIITLRLLSNDILSFHGSCFANEKGGFVITGLPGAGKTDTTLRLLHENATWDFVSEDILMIDGAQTAYGVPLTHTIGKRGPKSRWEVIREKSHRLFYKNTPIKKDVFAVLPEISQRLRNSVKINVVFFLVRAPICSSLLIPDGDKKNEIIKKIVKLNHLEFGYWRDELILDYFLFNADDEITVFMDKEAALARRFLTSVNLVELKASHSSDFAGLVSEWMRGEPTYEPANYHPAARDPNQLIVKAAD